MKESGERERERDGPIDRQREGDGERGIETDRQTEIHTFEILSARPEYIYRFLLPQGKCGRGYRVIAGKMEDTFETRRGSRQERDYYGEFNKFS